MSSVVAGGERTQTPEESVQSLVIASSTGLAGKLTAVEHAAALWADALALPTRIASSSHDSVVDALRDPSSALARNRNGANVVVLHADDWLAGNADLVARARELGEALRDSATRHGTPHTLVVVPSSTRHAAFAAVEQALSSFTSGLVELVSGDALRASYPEVTGDDAEATAALGTMIARRAFVHRLPAAKVLAIDCDNTLWTGIVGEDGPTGVKIDEGRRALQELLVAQQAAGVLLCLCSKNNEADAWEVFTQQPSMPLRREHIVSSRINWSAKSQNIRELAAELDLGLDSFVFLDDNPQEIAEVRAQLPEVRSLTVPQSLDELVRFTRQTWLFDRRPITEEDRRRTEMYRQNAARRQHQSAASSLQEFLASLQLEVVIDAPAQDQLARSAQLTQKTNQFNTTTLRRNEAELREALGAGLEAAVVTVKDRFGDYGLVGLVLHRSEGDALRVDTLLLSCRVLGKGVEHRILHHLAAAARAKGASRIALPYVRSRKNAPALGFLDSLDAERDGTDEQATYRLTLAQAEAAQPTEMVAVDESTGTPVAPVAETKAALHTRAHEALRTSAHVASRLASFTRTPRFVAVGATFTADPIEEPLALWLKSLGAPERATLAPYDQLFQELLAADSVFARNRAGLNVGLLRVEDWLGRDVVPASVTPDLVERARGTGRELAEAWARAASRGSYLLVLCPASPKVRAHAGVADALASIEHALIDAPGVDAIVAPPIEGYYDARRDELGHVPYGNEMFASLASLIAHAYAERFATPVAIDEVARALGSPADVQAKLLAIRKAM